jgi:predicted nucleic acid-binding protein
VIVLDTTVLVYSVGGGHPYREPCRALLEAVAEGRLHATTTVEAIQEFAHVRGRRRGREDARALATAMTDLLAPLLITTEAHLRSGLSQWHRDSPFGAFDSVLAAAALASGAEALVSADQGFGSVKGLVHRVPDARGVAELIG